jgi:hypothetical protein
MSTLVVLRGRLDQADGWTAAAALRGEDRGNVGLVAGAADRRAKSRTWGWKSCRAA